MAYREGNSTIMVMHEEGGPPTTLSSSPVDVERQEADCNTQHPWLLVHIHGVIGIPLCFGRSSSCPTVKKPISTFQTSDNVEKH